VVVQPLKRIQGPLYLNIVQDDIVFVAVPEAESMRCHQEAKAKSAFQYCFRSAIKIA
jgi:hypothetical protein